MRTTRKKFNLILTLVMMLTMAQTTWAQEAAVYDLVTEVLTVDGGQATNMQSSYDYGSLVDGDTSTKYYLSNADPWVEFHYSQAFVPKKYVLWTAFDTNNNSYRNPASWTIKAKLNKTDAWTTIATAENSGSNQLPTGNTQSKEFSIIENENAYKYFRFEATGQSNHVQLGELQFKVASAKTELTWNMSNQSSMQYTISGNSADFVSYGNTMRYTWTGTPGWNLWGSGGCYLFHKVIENQLQVTFPYLTGKVTKVEINDIDFSPSGMRLSVGNGKANLKNGNSDYFESTDVDEYRSVSFTGEIDVNTTNYLRFTFVKTASGNVSNQRFDFHNKGSIKVTLEKEQKPDLGHTFTSITTSGNVLTATCASTDADHNTLYGGAGHHYTLTLSAADGMAEPSRPVNASITPAVSDFNEDTQLGATCTVEYAPQGTSQGSSSWTTSAPYTVGNYTARATVSINSTNYVLTKNFSVIEGHYITNDYPQFTINKTGAMAGENVTVTFAPKMGESVATLTVTGDNTSLSIGSGISDNGDNTYTFAMPNENVTLGGTFTFPTNANFTQNNNTYTIKNADGWDYFCQRIQYDANLDGFSDKTVELAANISVTTMAGMVHPFKGTFDGKGKTLTFNRTADAMYTAPFQNTNGATISNLHVEGTITGGTNSYISGLVGSANGNLTIRDCHVSTQISTTFDSNTLSANVGIGGFVGLLSSQYNQCHITGCVFDGLIYNPNTWNQTYGCGGFVGCFSQYGYAILEDCLFIEGQYDNNGGKHELLWGHDNNNNSTFFHRTNNQGEGTLKNCFFVATHFLKQGSPAVESADAPDNFAHFGTPTDHGFLKVYGHTMVFDDKYYTPTYGDLVETYDYSGGKSYNIEYDDKPLGIPDITTQLWVPLLRYKRTFTNGKPVTVMMPFNFTKSAFKKSGSSDGLTGHFYEFKGINGSAPIMESDNEVTEMKANTPYLYVPDDEPEYWYIYNDGDGVNIFTEGYDGGNREATYDDLKLVGTYNIKTWDAPEVGTFILNYNGELELVTDGTMVKPTSAYVTERRFLELANGADNSDAIEQADHIGGVYEAVKLADRTLYKDGDWNTLTLPFALSAAEIAASPLAGATIMTLDGSTSNLDGEGLLTLNFETAYDPTIAPSGSIVAGRPYIVKWKPQADLFISSADDWNDFCTRVNNGTESYSGKTVRLTNNISVTKMAGTHSNPFRGTFEGDGYTIEVTLDNNGDTGTSDESYGVAPFRFTSGATIRNLHVGGTITTSTRKYAGGIVGKTVSGTNNIQNCWVSAEIYSTIDGDGTHGGFVGKVSGTANISNCLFDGVLTTASGNITNKCGGFVGWREGTLSISNSLYAPAAIPEGKYTIGTTDTYTFTRNNSSSYNTDNCLYTQALGGAQGTNASAMSNDDKLDKLGSGWIISNGHVVPKMEVEQMPNIVNPVFSNVTVEDPASTVVSFNGGEFVGNFAPLEITDANRKSIVLLAAGNKLGYAKTDRTIANGKALGACRAYFHIPSISGNAQTARSFVLNFGEENVTTGIIEVNTNTTNKSEGAFNLQGRRIVNPKKGLYIVNGKKIIIK